MGRERGAPSIYWAPTVCPINVMPYAISLRPYYHYGLGRGCQPHVKDEKIKVRKDYVTIDKQQGYNLKPSLTPRPWSFLKAPMPSCSSSPL